MGRTASPAPGFGGGIVRGLPTTKSQLSTVSSDPSALFTGTCPVVSGWMRTSSLGSSVPTYKQPPEVAGQGDTPGGGGTKSEKICMLSA